MYLPPFLLFSPALTLAFPDEKQGKWKVSKYYSKFFTVLLSYIIIQLGKRGTGSKLQQIFVNSRKTVGEKKFPVFKADLRKRYFLKSQVVKNNIHILWLN